MSCVPAEGHFLFSNVEPQYDVSMLSFGREGFWRTRVFLGITSDSPTIRVGAEGGRDTGAAKLSMTVGAASCPYVEGCSVSVKSESAHGFGQTKMSYLSGTTTLPLSLYHSFMSAAAPKEVAVHVFASTNSGSAFWYSKLSTTVAPEGVLAFTTSLLPVPLIGNFKATLPEGPGPLLVYAFLPGLHDPFLLGFGDEVSSFVVSAPNLAGAQLSAVGVRTFRTAVGTDEKVFRDASASTGELPLTSLSADLVLPVTPDGIQPRPNGSLQGKTGQFSWQSVGEQTTVLSVQSGKPDLNFEVVTNEESVKLQRLYSVGVAELVAGTYSIEIDTQHR